jgi:hypothetical protein
MSTQISISPIIKLEVNTTPITGGSAGQILFQTTGNTVGESANLFWDNTGFLGIGTSTPVVVAGYNGITINSTSLGAYVWFQSGGVTKYSIGSEGNINYHNLVAGTSFLIRGGSNFFNIVQSTGNVQIGTTTDAGFKLDVNGTARVTGAMTIGNSVITGNFGNLTLSNSGVAGVALTFTNNSWGSSDVAVFGTQGTHAHASSQIEIRSTTRGFLPPRMTTTEKNAIATPAAGLMIYDNTLNRPCFFNGTSWITL